MRIPARVQQKADAILARLKSQQIHPRKMREPGYYSVPVGRDYRLLSRDGGVTYALMTHERYSKICAPGGRGGK